MMTNTMIRTLQFVHMAVLVFVITGGLLPWREVWLVHMVFLPLMFLHWKTNQNRCVLTQIESRLKGEREVSESGFIKRLWVTIMRSEPSDRTIKRVTNSILVVAWLISATRYSLSLV